MKTFFKVLIAILIVLSLIYFLGPREKFETVDPSPFKSNFNIQMVEAYVNDKESKISDIKPDNQSQFYWRDRNNKTDYAILYLHGYSASHGECQPILKNLADRYNANSYWHRSPKAGRSDPDILKDLTPKELIDSAKEAIAIAKSIGNKLIIVSTSTGSTLATYLAAHDASIHAMIMTGPNFDLYDSNSHLMTKPWGKFLLEKIVGGKHRTWSTSSAAQKYWTTKNRIEGLICLRNLLDQTMTEEVFKKINLPLFIGYYFKNEKEKDEIISIDAIKNFYETINTEDSKKRLKPFTTARGHVIGSHFMNQNWRDVQAEIFKFCDEVLNMRPLPVPQEAPAF